ncbi:hypothetical protein Tco_1396338, partial [Tanacetum coccineum]
TAVCFMVLLEMQLEHRHGEKYITFVEDKQFDIHYPLDPYPPFKYVASANKLFLMRFACYFPISLIVIMYGLRAMLEKKKEFSDINGHLFQVVLFIFGSVGTLAVYAFYQGVKSKLAKNIGIMKMFMLLLGSRSSSLKATVVCWAVRLVWAFRGFSLYGN